MYILLSTLWFIWILKYVLFWLYLWQLKDYHIARFIDHFRTHKGKKLIFDFFQIAKLILLMLFLVASGWFIYLFSALFLVYSAEFALFVRGIVNKSLRKPVRTLKTIFLTAISFAVVVWLWFWVLKFKDVLQPSVYIALDILTPIIISAVVLFFQPFFVLLRNKKLSEAKDKIEKVKQVSGLKIVAITGSYGKTTTKEFLSAILSRRFKVLKTKEHQNSEIGVANCILQDLKPSHQIFIAEVGAYDKGKVKEVCSMIKPKIGIVTGVNEQHLALFGSLNNLLSAEGGGELAEALPKDGLLIVNGDNKYCLDLYKKTLPKQFAKKIYCLNNNAVDSDIWSESITVQEDSISFLAINKKGEMAHFGVKVLGKQNVQNLLGAILIAKELGMSFEEISEACKDISEEQGGMSLKKGKYNISIVDSSYSSNPDGVYADLDYFSIFAGKKVIVMPCLIELGEKSSMIHEKIGKKIGKICDLAIITTKDKFKEIEGGFNDTRKEGSKILLCDNAQDIYSAVTLFCKSGDAVLLEGRVPNGLINLLA